MSTAESLLRKAEIQKQINNIPTVHTAVTKDFIIPNLSGNVIKTPVSDYDIANKKYVDSIGGGNVSAAANLTDGTLIQGDGGVKGIKTTTITTTDAASAVSLKHTRKHDFNSTSDHNTIAGNEHELLMLDGNGYPETSGSTKDQLDTAYSHSQDNTQAHSDYLLNSGADEAVGPLTITADNSTADQAYVPMVLYNTDATPPAASGFPIGTIYIQYTP